MGIKIIVFKYLSKETGTISTIQKVTTDCNFIYYYLSAEEFTIQKV